MSFNVNNLSISLDDGKPIVENISFNIPKGKMLSIVGGSGAGKSTICRAIMGLLNKSYSVKGEIIYNEKNLFQMSHKSLLNIYGKDICYIMQNPMTAFNPSIRIKKQILKSYFHHHSKASRVDAMQNINDRLARLGISDTERVLNSYPFALSGGMLQRLMIATALINDPQVLIADEITTAIDACNRMELMSELRSLTDTGLSILFVTHDLNAAAKADSILIMNKGKLVEFGETSEIFSNPKCEYTQYLLNACRLERG